MIVPEMALSVILSVCIWTHGRSEELHAEFMSAMGEKCTGASERLEEAQCAAWVSLWDSTHGGEWKECSDARTNPCACAYVVCDSEQQGIVGREVDVRRITSV